MTDPLSINIPAAGVDTSRPLLPEGDYRLQVSKSEFGPSNFNDSILCWKPVLVTTQSEQSTTGAAVPPNTRIFLQYDFALAEDPEPKYPGLWLEALLNGVDAILGTTKDNRPDITKDVLDSCVGKTVIGHVIIDTDKGGVSRNKIKRLKKDA